MSQVTLVGGGPGDPGLITLRGIEALQRADAIVYDYLSPVELLAHAPPNAEIVYAGKRAGQHTLRQEEINALLIRLAQSGKRVVRLKGGDPFVFGRGGEEAQALTKAGIPFEVVPGISSAIAVPAYAGIPVTHRGVASSLAIVTGHEDPRKEESSVDWGALAKMDTLVVLMGVGKLGQVVEQLLLHGRPKHTPAALIERGTQGVQRTASGTLADIVEVAERVGVKPPAVIVVGDVVALRDQLDWFENRPLHGLRVLVGRTRQQASNLSSLLRSLGAAPIECPLIETVPPLDWAPLDAAIRDIQHFRWIIFTSANGVAFFFERLYAAGSDARSLAGARLAAIGSSTSSALAAHGLRADLVPNRYVAEALADEMGDVRGAKILLPLADIARPVLAQHLAASGALVEKVDAYRTVRPEGLAPRLRELLTQIDVVAFTSSSTVQHLVESVGEEQARRALQPLCTACLGPMTANALQELGMTPTVVAQEFTVQGLVQAITAWRSAQRKEDTN